MREETQSVTNFPTNQRELYDKAIEECGNSNLYIMDIAYDDRGKVVVGYSALMRYKYEDLSKFWAIVERLKSSNESEENRQSSSKQLLED